MRATLYIAAALALATATNIIAISNASAAAWLMIFSSATEKHQAIQAIEYPTIDACAKAMALMKVSILLGAMEKPYCSEQKPTWWRVGS